MDHLAKAQACVRAWRRLYGTEPSRHAVLMVCSVAALESRCGDSWGECGNWGCIQRRGLTPDEKALAKAGGKPIPKDLFEILKGDSSPIKGRYSVFFWAFPQRIIYPPAALSGHEAGAWKLLQVLLEQRPAIKARIDTIDSHTLAELMYRSLYFEGGHDPRAKIGEAIVNGLTVGQRANIDDYAGVHGGGISANLAAFESKVPKDWDPATVLDLSAEDVEEAKKASADALEDTLDEGEATHWGHSPEGGF